MSPVFTKTQKQDFMIFDLTCNGQSAPISIDRTVCLNWQTDFNMTGFSVRIQRGKERVFEEFVSSPVGFYEYTGALQALTEYQCVVTCFGEGIEECAQLSFRTALVGGFPEACKWIGAGSTPLEQQSFHGNPATYLWKEFTIQKVEKTFVHLAGLGLFVLEVNGKKASNDVLNCPFTNYEQSVLYANYEITDLLQEGHNEIKIVLGDGWFNQTATDEWDFYKAAWRDNAKAIVLVEGGATLYSDESWHCSTDGKIRSSSIRLGECVDFSKDEYASAQSAIRMRAPKGKFKSMEEFPIRETEVLDYKRVKVFKDCFQLDFETSITGYVRLSLSHNGRIKIRYGDRLSADGRIDNASNAQYVYGGEYQTDSVTGGGERFTYKPYFTYHAFRYVEIEGLTEIPSKEEIKAVFIRSSFPKIGDFSCSNERLNTFYKLSVRSLECNYTGIPTDCPHREKNGWTGDMQLSASVFIKNYGLAVNIYKWLEDICEAQTENGQIPCIVPTSTWGYAWGNGPAWDYALFALPYELYTQRGDTHAIRLVYAACEKYLRFLEGQEQGGLLELGLGDWNYPKKVELELCPLKLISSCYYYSMTKLFAVFSRVLGEGEKQAVYERKSEEIRRAIRAEFLKKGGEDLKGMTALSAMLYFGIAEGIEREDIFRRLVALIEAERYRALFGILGAKYVHNVLCEMGRADVFVKMMECNEYPSFGVWLSRGATTLWEDYEGTNSRNHHMFADIAAVMQTYLLGIKQTEENGRYTLVIEPYLDGFDRLQGQVATANGRAFASYERSDGGFDVRIELPYGVEAAFRYKGQTIALESGITQFKIKSL